MGSRAICLWSRAITKKEASLETPPVNVVLRPLGQTRRRKGNNDQEVHSTSAVPSSAPPIHIYNQPAPTTSTPSTIVPAASTQSGDQNPSELATILQFVGPICAAAIQKNNAPSADIVSQFTNALAKPFPHALTDVANYMSSLSSNGIALPSMSHTPSFETNHMLSTNQLNPVSTTSIRRKEPLIPRTDVLSSPIEEEYRGDWLQGYMNW